MSNSYYRSDETPFEAAKIRFEAIEKSGEPVPINLQQTLAVFQDHFSQNDMEDNNGVPGSATVQIPLVKGRHSGIAVPPS